MLTRDNRVLSSLEKWSSTVFLVAGVLLLVAAVATGIEWLTDVTGLTNGPLGVAAFIGMVVSYVGLLGLYPRLDDENSRLALVSVLLVLVPLVVIIVEVGSVVLGFGPLYGLLIASAGFLLFALGIALFGVASLRSRTTSNAAGASLFAYSGAWVAFIGIGQIYGFPVSGGALFGISVTMTVSLLALWYVLRGDTVSTERRQATPDSTA